MPKNTPVNSGQATKPGEWDHFQAIFPADFQKALDNNYPPNPDVLRSAKAFRENPAYFTNASKKRIKAIDQQVKTLQEERARLADEGAVRRAVKDACAKVCAPIRRIPRDVMHEIAQYAAHEYPSIDAYKFDEPPLNLLRVSSAWREVVLRTPRLWSRLYLCIDRLDQRSVMKYAEVVNTWFGRAGSHPLHLYLYLNCEIEMEEGTDSLYHIHLLLKSITRWAPRITRFGIGGDDLLRFLPMFGNMQWNFPNLHTLELLGQQATNVELVDMDMGRLATLSPHIHLFDSAPNLTTLFAQQEMTAYFESFTFIPWQNLTTVILEERLSQEHSLRQLFSAMCPKVETASLCWIASSDSMPFAPQLANPIRVDNLKQLKLEFRPRLWNDLSRFFSQFTFHALTHLELTIEDSQATPAEPIMTFGGSPFPSLTVLRLDGGFPVTFVNYFLRVTPQLRTLVFGFLHDMGCLDNFFKALTVPNDNFPEYSTVPLLEECFVQTSRRMILLDVSTVAGFIRSRTKDLRPPFARLRKLRLAGAFAFLGDLRDEVARFNDTTHPRVQIELDPSGIFTYELMHRIEFPDADFAGLGGNDYLYREEVEHTGLLSS